MEEKYEARKEGEIEKQNDERIKGLERRTE